MVMMGCPYRERVAYPVDWTDGGIFRNYIETPSSRAVQCWHSLLLLVLRDRGAALTIWRNVVGKVLAQRSVGIR